MISIIVPVFRAEKYLHACVESLLVQDCDVEIILVDDGSDDTSGAICDEFARNNSNVRAIHQTNQGQSAARNAGLEIACGEYIGFVDADDTVEPDTYPLLLQAIQGHDVAMCIGREIPDGATPTPTPSDGKTTRMDRDGLLYEILVAQNCSVCNKLFRAELIKSSRFPTDLRHCEELLFHLSYLPRVDGGVKIEVYKYNYFQHPNSTTRKSSFSAVAFGEVISHDRALKIVQKEFTAYTGGILLHGFTARMNVMRKLYLYRKENEYRELISQYREYWHRYYPEVKHMIPARRRIEYWLYCHAKWLYACMIKLIAWKKGWRKK